MNRTSRSQHSVMNLQQELVLPSDVVSNLFPFHLLIENTDQQKVVSAGESLRKLLDSYDATLNVGADIEILRPSATTLSIEHAQIHLQTPYVIRIRDSDIILRGQIILTQNQHFLFLGSILVRDAKSFDNLEIGLKHFAPLDLTPDMLILHRFREMQANDQETRSEQLRVAEAARIESDKYANTDVLTGIANRRGFWSAGEEALESRQKGHTVVLLLIDLERFKFINDKYGHREGDKVLSLIGERLKTSTEEYGIAARLGGDEFVALVSLPQGTEHEPWVEELAAAIRSPAPSVIQGLPIDCSIGAAVVRENERLHEAMQHADYALSEGRKQTRNSIRWDTPELQEKLEQRTALLTEIKSAVDNKVIYPVFQPLVDLEHNTLIGFETLARWHHPKWGMIAPDTFIELAERAGLLPALDRLMLQQALDQLVIWREEAKFYRIHINISAPSLQPELFTFIESALQTRKLEPDCIVLELTETSFLEDSRSTRHLFNALTSMGISLQLDDFGTGYSSLTHLLKFPVSGIKIDRSFIHEAHSCRRTKALLESVFGIASNLGLETVAEGIETVEQIELLRGLGCDHGQGYLLGKPELAEECEDIYDFLQDQVA